MYNVYKIKSGDTIEEIAKAFSTTIDRLLELNALDGNSYLRVGEEIIVPETSKNYFEYYTVNKGDSIYAISRRYNINPELLASLNGLNNADYIYPGQVILIPKSNYSYYITKEGDTLDSVVNLFGTNKEKFLDENESLYLLDGQLLVNRK